MNFIIQILFVNNINMSKTQNSEIIIMLQRKNKEQEAAIKTLKTQAADLKKGESGAEGKIKALNEIHS